MKIEIGSMASLTKAMVLAMAIAPYTSADVVVALLPEAAPRAGAENSLRLSSRFT